MLYAPWLLLRYKLDLYLIKSKNPLKLRGFFVGLLGLEPRKTAPKTVVLPLHHRPVLLNASANLIQILFYTNK